ncbi:hypothetical protein K3495_g5120 [Podosphaera aphanis]|nr:hypothetical protein K3495_g5120 [Podosphaera aphanis]
MARFRTPSLRRLVAGALPTAQVTQRRWAQVHELRFRLLATQSNPVLERYKEKLAQKAQEHGLRDVQELRQIYQDNIAAVRQEAAVTMPRPSVPPACAAPISSCPAPSSPRAIKTLASYLDVDKTRALAPADIELVWRRRHLANAQSLCAVIPLPVYRSLEVMARKYPTFILPLPRQGQATEIHYLQWAFPAANVVTVLFTHLAEYKLRGEFSQPHTTVTHHLELAEEKGIVLLRGEVMEGRGVSVDEAKWLLLCLQRFYGGLGEKEEASKRRSLVEMFGKGEPTFRVEDLVEEAEKVV